MPYIVLFTIIGIATFIVCSIIGIIIACFTDEEMALMSIPAGMVALLILVLIGAGIHDKNVSTYRADNYDLEKLYALYESTPNCICTKKTEETAYYYDYSQSCGVYVSDAYIDQIYTENLVGNKTKVKYTIYIPSEQALDKKTAWEQLDGCRLQADEKSKPAEKAENDQNEEQE